jgi:hypothetical protein
MGMTSTMSMKNFFNNLDRKKLKLVQTSFCVGLLRRYIFQVVSNIFLFTL